MCWKSVGWLICGINDSEASDDATLSHILDKNQRHWLTSGCWAAHSSFNVAISIVLLEFQATHDKAAEYWS